MDNIEKSISRKGEYVGYCKGAQRIRRGGEGWETYMRGSIGGEFVKATARTLEELSEKLKELNK